MEQWWQLNDKVDLGSYTQGIIEDLTGRNPLLLDSCVRSGKIDLFAKALQDVFNEVRAFIIKIHGAQNDDAWNM